MALNAHEFIRRYLSHVLPDGFMRVRSFGLLANACKTKNIALIRKLLHDKQVNSASMASDSLLPSPLENKTVEDNQLRHLSSRASH